MRVSLIKHGTGNTHSVHLALERLGVLCLITDNFDEISSSDKVIFPGVGEASTTMRNLEASGLDKLIPTLKQPVLGICLGMQLFCRYSEENNTACLGIFPQIVRKFPSKFKVPHAGWNTISAGQGPLFKGVREEAYVYFVHSYYVEQGMHEIACTDYCVTFSAAINSKNFFGVQFHPEKSGETGSLILKNFLELEL